MPTGTVSGKPKFVAEFARICDEYRESKETWINQLKAEGYKAAHPNDGWVDRENNRVKLAYPYFDYGLEAGDKLMLGWSDLKHNRSVIITKVEPGIVSSPWYYFEDNP